MRRVLLLLSVLAAACAGPPAGRRGGPGHVVHVVLFWLRPDAPPGTRDAFRAEIERTLPEVGGLVDGYVGTPIPSERPVVDASYDLLLVMRFRDAAAAKAWDGAPAHDAVRARFGPHIARLVVHDAAE